MVIKSNHGNWRKEYFNNIRDTIIPITIGIDPYPEEIDIPVSSKFSMCELGGSKHSSGLAMLIATPSGFPNSIVPLTNLKVNGLHSVCKVWIGSLITIASHQFGKISIGIYQLSRFSKTNDINIGHFKLLTGIKNKPYVDAHELTWISPYDKKYPGLKKLVSTTLTKLELYNCDTPLYLEPLKILNKHTKYDADIIKLIDNSTDIKNTYNNNASRYKRILKHIGRSESFVLYRNFEQKIIDTCRHYHNSFSFVYVLLVHRLDVNEELQTHAFIILQNKPGEKLLFHSPSYVYDHTCINKRSVEMEGYLKTNYNDAYKNILLGTRGKGIRGVYQYIESSPDACHYVPLKYSLCTLKYSR